MPLDSENFHVSGNCIIVTVMHLGFSKVGPTGASSLGNGTNVLWMGECVVGGLYVDALYV